MAWRGLLFGFVLAVAACTTSEPVDPPACTTCDGEPPTLVTTPPPGDYGAFSLPVSISAGSPEWELFYDIDRDPAVEGVYPYVGSFSVRIIRTSQIVVLARRAGNPKLWGPYFFEYRLTSPIHDGACAFVPPARTLYTGGVPIPLTLQYRRATALSRLEMAVDGVWTELAVSDGEGAESVTIGPFATTGARTVDCRIVDADEKVWPGEELVLDIDADAPTAAWGTAAQNFTRMTWRNQLRVDVADVGSGVDRVLFCNGATDVCGEAFTPDGLEWVYATALTDRTDTAVSLSVRVTDLAGNETVLPARAFGWAAFAEAWAEPPAESIPMTTEARWPLADVVGVTPAEVYRPDGSPMAATETVNDLWLAPGWNEFFYRPAGSLEWRTHAVYRSGASITLPAPAGQWLVYASESTVPGFEAVRLGAYGAGEVPYAGFRVPHLFAVDDRHADDRWDAYDTLVTNPADRYEDRFLAVARPLVVATAPWPMAAHATDAAAMLDADAGLPAKPVLFQWRPTLYAWPVTHVSLGAPAFPLAVSVPATGVCAFILDENEDGAVNIGEARVVDDCAPQTFTIARRHGPLRFSASRILGVPYGGLVTSVVTVRSPSGVELLRYPLGDLLDRDGIGIARIQPDFRYPQLPVLGRFYAAGEVTWATAPILETPAWDETMSVAVTDEAGNPVVALVMAGEGAGSTYAATDDFGAAVVGLPSGGGLQRIMAVREGMLSHVVYAEPAASVELRVLSPGITGWVTGVVRDENLTPVANAEVAWHATQFHSRTLTGPDGSYGLPASGGTGSLTVSAAAVYGTRFDAAALYVTGATEVHDFILPPDGIEGPQGLHGAIPPTLLEGPSPAVLRYADPLYAALLTGPASGAWDAVWSMSGLRRRVQLPGNLPAYNITNYGAWPTPFNLVGFNLKQRAVCGAWWQEVNGLIMTHLPCWTWVASDGLQTFVLGQEDETGYPDHDGLGLVMATVRTNSGNMPANQTLLFDDLVLAGRTILVPVESGAVSAAIPAGTYAVRTAAGATVMGDFGEARVVVEPRVYSDRVEDWYLRLP